MTEPRTHNQFLTDLAGERAALIAGDPRAIDRATCFDEREGLPVQVERWAEADNPVEWLERIPDLLRPHIFKRGSAPEGMMANIKLDHERLNPISGRCYECLPSGSDYWDHPDGNPDLIIVE